MNDAEQKLVVAGITRLMEEMRTQRDAALAEIAALKHAHQDVADALVAALAECERLRAIVVAQGEAILHQRKHNRNVEQKRGDWRKKFEEAAAKVRELARDNDRLRGELMKHSGSGWGLSRG